MFDVLLNWFIDGIRYASSGGAYLKKAEARRLAELGPMAGFSAERDPVLGQVRYVRRLTRWMVGIGLVLVWVVGAGVKIIMESLRKATLPWTDLMGRSFRDFLSKLPDLAFTTLLFGVPFLLAAFMGKRYVSERVAAGIEMPAFRRYASVVLCAYVGAVLTAIFLCGCSWWYGEFGLMMFFFLPAIILGAALAYFMGFFIIDPERKKAEEGPDTPPWCAPQPLYVSGIGFPAFGGLYPGPTSTVVPSTVQVWTPSMP